MPIDYENDFVSMYKNIINSVTADDFVKMAQMFGSEKFFDDYSTDNQPENFSFVEFDGTDKFSKEL